MSFASIENKFLGYIRCAKNALAQADALRAKGQDDQADDETAYARTMIKRANLIAGSVPAIASKYKTDQDAQSQQA